MVNQVWGKHATVVTGDQGSAQVSKNEWNENLNRKGLLGFDSETIASASSVTIPDDSSDDVSSFIKLSGSTSVDTLVTTNTSEGDLLFIITTGSVTLNNTSSPSSAGDIRLLANANKDLSTTVPTILMRVSDYWYEYGGGATVDAGDLTGTTLASGVITSSLTTVGTIGTGVWNGTAVGDTYISSASTWNGKQDALTFGISDGNVAKCNDAVVDNDFLKIDGTEIEGRSASEVLSDIGGQASLSFGISNTNVTKCGTGIVDDDFIRIDGTTMEGRSASEVLSDIGASAVAGSSSIVTTGALDSGSITSGFGTINNGSSTITTTGALASGAITTSGTLTMGDNIITGIHSLDMDVDTVAYAATVDVDFDDNEVMILGDLTGNIAFTGSNYALGKGRTFHMESDGSARTFTFPSGWVFYGTKPTTTVASKKSILTLSCIGSAEADVRAVFVEEA